MKKLGIDIQGFLAVAIIAVIFSIVGMLLYKPPTLDDKTSAVLTTIIGVLIGAMKDVFSYYFGSSKGSAAKDDALLTGALASTLSPAEPPSAPKPPPVTPVTPAAPSFPPKT